MGAHIGALVEVEYILYGQASALGVECSAGGAGTTVTGALTGGISGRVAGSVEAIRVGGVASPLDGAEGTQRRTARSSSAR